jgi:hypothetical protein
MTVSTIRDGLKTRLATISGLRAHDTIPDNPSPPFAVVVPGSITFDSAFARGLDEYEFSVLVVVSRVSERVGQDLLDGYCNPSGATSIKAAIEGDRTLAGAATDLRVTQMRNYQALTIGEVQYLAAEFVIQLYATA